MWVNRVSHQWVMSVSRARCISRVNASWVFLDGYCSTVQDLLEWFEVDLGFTELLFIQIGLCVLCVLCECVMSFWECCALRCAQHFRKKYVYCECYVDTRPGKEESNKQLICTKWFFENGWANGFVPRSFCFLVTAASNNLRTLYSKTFYPKRVSHVMYGVASVSRID